jgi:hypothetical protein
MLAERTAVSLLLSQRQLGPDALADLGRQGGEVGGAKFAMAPTN